jgi:transposase InsO family protein
MTDYQTLPPSVPSVIDLDARIAAAFADCAKSNDVATLIKDTEHVATSASDQAAQARNHALDPTLSGSELKDARTCMDDAAFKRVGTIRREFLDHVLIWNAIDLERKLEEFRNYYNANRVHQSLNGSTPGERSGTPPPAHAVLDHYAWRHHCRGLFQMPIAA